MRRLTRDKNRPPEAGGPMKDPCVRAALAYSKAIDPNADKLALKKFSWEKDPG